jgi:dihydroflavonol-4-reductase
MILVTGGTGLVGSHLLLSLVKKGYRIKAIKRKASDVESVRKVFSWYLPEEDDLFRNIEWIECDILDYFTLKKILIDVDIIYHCAAEVSFDKRKRHQMIQNNVEGTANLINAALSCEIKRFCHISSIAALGKTTDGSLITEESSWLPSGKNSGYSESKFYSEAEVWRGVEEGLEAVIVNPSIIIGPGNWNKGSCRFFSAVFKGLRFYTSGENGYVDVRDVADAVMLLTDEVNFSKAKNQKFLLNSDNLRHKYFLDRIAEAVHKPGPDFRATRFMLHLVGSFSAVWSGISGKENIFSKETLSSAQKINRYDGTKITKQFAFRYRSVDEAILHTAECFMSEPGHRSGMEHQ